MTLTIIYICIFLNCIVMALVLAFGNKVMALPIVLSIATLLIILKHLNS